MTLQEYKDFAKIDYDDEDTILENFIEVAQIYIDSMVGEEYKEDEKAVKLSELALKKIVTDMYENRNANVQSNYRQDPIVNSILDKLSIYNSKG